MTTFASILFTVSRSTKLSDLDITKEFMESRYLFVLAVIAVFACCQDVLSQRLFLAPGAGLTYSIESPNGVGFGSCAALDLDLTHDRVGFRFTLGFEYETRGLMTGSPDEWLFRLGFLAPFLRDESKVRPYLRVSIQWITGKSWQETLNAGIGLLVPATDRVDVFVELAPSLGKDRQDVILWMTAQSGVRVSLSSR